MKSTRKINIIYVFSGRYGFNHEVSRIQAGVVSEVSSRSFSGRDSRNDQGKPSILRSIPIPIVTDHPRDDTSETRHYIIAGSE
jgi:hypothetical protein